MFNNFLNRALEPAYTVDEFIELLYSNAQDDTPLTIYFDGISEFYLSPEHLALCELRYIEQSLLDPERFVLSFELTPKGTMITCGDVVSILDEMADNYANCRIDQVSIGNRWYRKQAGSMYTKYNKWQICPDNEYGTFRIDGKVWVSWKENAGPYLG